VRVFSIVDDQSSIFDLRFSIMAAAAGNNAVDRNN
jgi:hypothetical protein